MTLSKQERQELLISHFKNMTVLELSEFVKEFEEAFNVKASVPAVTPVPVPATEEPEEETQTEFTVILESFGDKKIQVIKEVRSITKLGLADAKVFVDNLPHPVLENVSRDVAEQAKAALEKAGATVKMI